MVHEEDNQLARHRLTVLMLVCMATAVVVLMRAAYVQILRNPRLENMAKRQFQTHALIRPRRGTIFDRNGEPLAVNLETNSLAANPIKIKNKRHLARLLARSTDLPYGKLLQRLREKKEFVWIKRHLSEQELRRLKKWRIMDAEGDFVNGLWVVKESERVYPHGRLASHVLGDVNVDSEGLEGIELWFNDRLRGKVASVTAIKDALGRPTFIDAVAANSVEDGESIRLTIDASLQYEIEQELSNAVHRTGSKAGTVIALDSSNGEILAMANVPGFTATEKNISPDRRRNRAVTDGFEPGSTMKAILAAALLSNGSQLSEEVWGERGSFSLQGHKISEAEAKEKFEWVSLKKMIQVSSNVAAAKFALKLGADQYLKVLKSFGFGTKTGLGFPGEISGKLPPRKDWSPLTTANIGFGQGLLVTPLQMVRAYAAILNGGWLVQPTLLKKDKNEQEQADLNHVPPRVLSRRVSSEVIEALESVTVEGGTGVRAALPGYRVAGKTGTAQMVDVGTGHYSKDKYIASFIGFPVHVQPKVVIFVSLVEPHGVYYAAETAAPLFKEVLGAVANRCSMPIQTPPKNEPNSVSPLILAEGHSMRGNENELKVNNDRLKFSQAALEPVSLEQGRPGWIMPSLVGLTPRESIRVLQGHLLHLEVQGTGIVSSQVPESGKTIAEGGTIRLILAEP